MLDDFGNRSSPIGQHRRTAGHRFDQHEAEGLGPIVRTDKGGRITEKIVFLSVRDFSDIFDQRMFEEPLDLATQKSRCAG